MAAGDLATVEELRVYLGEETLDSGDELASYVSAASVRFLREVGAPIVNAAQVDQFDGDEEDEHPLDVHPVVSVESVWVDGAEIPKRVDVKGEGWVLNKGRVILAGNRYLFTRGVVNCEIRYTSGYGEAAPEDVKRAVVELAGLMYRYKSRIGIMSSNAGGESVSYQTLTLPESVRSVIELYRAVRVR